MTISKFPLGDDSAGVSFTITQSSHGFAVGDVLRLSGTTYAKAQADTEDNAEVIGIVSEVLTTNVFVLATNGKVEGLSSLTAGTVYYLSDTVAGAMTATEPADYGEVSKPVLIADTTTSGFILNLRGQLIGTYESEDKYDIGLAASRPSTPMTGKMYYGTDDDNLGIYDGGWKDITMGQWIDYTPTIAQGGATPNITKTVGYCRYMRLGRLIIAQGNLTLTGAGTSGQVISITLPVTAGTQPTNGNSLGTFEAYDLSAGTLHGGVATTGGNTGSIVGRHYSGSGAGNSIGSGTATFALASGDQLFFSIQYEVAS